MAHASEQHELLVTEILATVFGELDAPALALLREHLSWVELAGGQTLMVQGEPGDAMYLSISGRLRAYVEQEGGGQRMVREMSRGQVIGEMSLFTDAPRSATVVALRDSVLMRLDKQQFLALTAQSAQVCVALTRQIIERLKTEHQPRPFAAPVTIGVVPVSAGVALPGFAQDLAAQLQPYGRVRVLDGATVAAELGGPIADRAEMSRRTSLLLDEVEAMHDFVLLVADQDPSDWTHRCARHSDELLLVADATQPPAVHAIETECLVNRSPRTEAAEILVLLHAADVPCPQGTAQWLARRPVTDHLHIRPTLTRDMARLARFEARKAVGLVLAGGGARGFAHLGVLRALQEQGIEIDCVGGTSMGALMGMLVASDRPLPELMDLTRKVFRSNPTGDFNAIPLVSLIKGLRMRRMLVDAVHKLFGGDADIEDLWKNYFCIATNYSQAREDSLRSGKLRQAVLASIAIPGAFPPVVRDGDLLCDGGTFNNFPVDVMRERRGIGTVIGADLSLHKPRRIEFEEVPGTWTLLRDRMRSRKARRYRLPSLVNYLLNVTILYSVSRRGAAKRMSDIYFNPPLERVGLLEWARFDQIVKQGYEHALEVLAPKQGAETAAAPGSAQTHERGQHR